MGHPPFTLCKPIVERTRGQLYRCDNHFNITVIAHLIKSQHVNLLVRYKRIDFIQRCYKKWRGVGEFIAGGHQNHFAGTAFDHLLGEGGLGKIIGAQSALQTDGIDADEALVGPVEI